MSLLLKEDGDYLLLENGVDRILLEGFPEVVLAVMGSKGIHSTMMGRQIINGALWWIVAIIGRIFLDKG